MNKFHPILFLIIFFGCTSVITQAQTPSSPSNQPIQDIADEAAHTALNALHPRRVVVIVAEPLTGKILALSSRRVDSKATTDDAVSWFYEPGSTFKPVVAVAALEEGKITPTTKIFCENGAFTIADKTIKDQTPSGDLTFDEILTKSSNIGAAKMAQMLTDPVYHDYIHRLGFGDKTGIAIPGEVQGIVHPTARWDALTKARMAFGQSVAVTPIQLAMAYCALANGGLLMKPVVGDEKSVVVRRVCSAETANTVKKALQGTVSDTGTAPLAKVEGVTVGGKTGTSEVLTPDGQYLEGRYTTSFVGFFPVEKPKYVIVVVVDDALLKPEQNYGGLVAAPIFADIAGKISKLN